MKSTIKRDAITAETVAKALRRMRARQRLTQSQMARRAREFGDQRFGKLLESQISDFERGRTLPSFGSLLNLLAGCSSDGTEVDFSILQEALVFVLSTKVEATGPEEHTEPGAHTEPEAQDVDRSSAISTLSNLAKQVEDLMTSTEQELQEIKVEISALRAQMTVMERLIVLSGLQERMTTC